MVKKLILKRSLFWIIIVLLPFLCIELVLRVFFAIQVGPDVLLYGIRSSRYQEIIDPGGFSDRKEGANHTVDNYDNLLKGYWKYSSRQEVVEHNEQGDVFKVSINSRGFRGEDFHANKKEGTLRVITLGASSTFGYHDKDSETYPAYLQDSLNAMLHRTSCGRANSAEVINLGIPHLESDNIFSLFVSEALPLDPDIVTFYEGINDAHVERASTGPPGRRRGWLRNLISRTYFELRTRSITIALIGNLHSTMAARFSRDDVQKHIEGKADHFVRNLSRIREQCAARDIIFIVATQQAKSLMIENDKMKNFTYDGEVDFVKKKLNSEGWVSMGGRDLITHDAIMLAVKEWTRNNDVSMVDVIGALDKNRDALVSWVHLNPVGNRIVASAFTAKILREICNKKF